MLSKKKKFLILGVMVVLLGVTAYLNVALNNKVVDTSAKNNNITTASFFASYRDDRKNTRDQEIAYYDAIISSETTSAENKAQAETKRLELVAQMEKELAMENLIKAKGFADVIVTNSSESINVVVKSGELQASEVAQIVAVVQDQTKADIDNIKIIPVE